MKGNIDNTQYMKSEVDRSYNKRKEEGRGLMSVECCIRKAENSLSFKVLNSEENLLCS